MRRLLLWLILSAAIGCQSSTDTARTSDDHLQEIISQFESELQRDLAIDNVNGSISAAIVKENRIVWSKAYGFADPSQKILADTTTVYRAGSISKAFTAFLMMQLVEEGRIRLDDPIELYVPEIKTVQGYSDSTRITFMQLASHTAGLATEPELRDADKGPINEWEKRLIESIPATHFESKPGTKFNYSNIGYGILGFAVSRAAGKPFMQLVEDKILIPLNMKHSFFTVPDGTAPGLAVGMQGGPTEVLDTKTPEKEHLGRGYKVPSGGIYSTPNDLAKFMICNMGYRSILEDKSLELMQTEKSPVLNKYGLGFMVFHNDQVDIVGHSGQVFGYTAQFAFERESKFGVILMRNYTRGATDLDKSSFVLLSKLRQLVRQ